MKRKWRLLLAILGILFVSVAVVLGGGYFLLVRTLNVRDYSRFADIPLYTWARLELSDKTGCSDGSDYHIYARRGESANLIVHFSGGGMCWNGETCSQPITLTHLTGYYFSSIFDIGHAILDGVFQTGSADNPFHDWNVVYLPYCTADFHVGATDQTFSLADGSAVTIHFSGRQNVTEALDYVFATFEHPDKLLISGESAGAFGSTLWTPYIASRYPASDVYQLADGAFLHMPQWSDITDQVWKADMPANFGFEPGDDLVGDTYRHDSEVSLPNVTFLQLNTLYDGTLIRFDAKLNAAADDAAYRDLWSQEMRASLQSVADSGLNYFYYVTDYGLDARTAATPHTSITAPLFYSVQQDGVFLRDWLRRIVEDGEHFSVGSEFLP